MRISKGILILAAVGMGASAWARPVTAVLRLKANVSMETLAHMVTDPSSPRYQQFFTPEEIRSVSAPTDAQYAAQLQQLRGEGFQVVGESKTHLWVSVRGERAQFENTFATQLKELSGGRHQLMMAARIPTHWGLVEGVTGLDSSSARHPHYKLVPQDGTNPPTQGVTPSQIKTIYGFEAIYSSGLNGAGQHIAIATYDDVNLSDVNGYYANIGLTPTPVVDRVLFNGTPSANENSALETSLDAEFSGMIAPGAAIHVFTSATNDDAGETKMFTSILDDNRAKVVNYSWGDCEKNLTPAHQAEMAPIMARAVAQGVNMMVASGDSGSSSCQNDTTVQADWPAANPNVVAVGGTSLRLSGSTVSAENVWGPCLSGFAGCTGGGISVLWDLPDYQKGFQAPYTKRSYPDVAFNADNMQSGEPVWGTNQGTTGWIVIGGTSMAAPQWSGLMALVGQARQNAGKGALGFLNPIIYGLTDAQRATVFNDITSGTNGAYNAGTGWDATTGWGSPKANAFLNFLVTN